LFEKQKHIDKVSFGKASNPRATQTSIRAGALEPRNQRDWKIQRTKSNPEKERQKKTREAEEQLLRRARIGIEENMAEDSTSKRVYKPMISPTAKDAPKFKRSEPEELSRFIDIMESLWANAGIENEDEKKHSLGKYADKKTEDQWKAFETYGAGHTWEEFKEELLDNYPEAAESERGTPRRLKELCKKEKGIRMGDLSTLHAFRREFVSEAKKLGKEPAVMSNRELVEMFIGTLSQPFAAAVIQYLGNQPENKKGKQSSGGTSRRPEDRYDLEEVYKAASQVSENSQGMFSLMNSFGMEIEDKKTVNQFQLQPAAESTRVVQKLESLENIQAEEKDKLDIANKKMDSRFNDLENMMKTVISHIQNGGKKEQVPEVPQYDPSSGIRLGQAGTIPRWAPNGRSNSNMFGKCFYCGGKEHYVPECEELKKDLRIGRVKINGDKKFRMPDGSWIPNEPNGAPIKEKIERELMRKENQFYCGYEEEEDMIPRYPEQYVNIAESPYQRKARLERELDLKEKEDELEMKKIKFERETKKREQVEKPTKSQLIELIEKLAQGESQREDFQ
jgi:hypothetical protein